MIDVSFSDIIDVLMKALASLPVTSPRTPALPPPTLTQEGQSTSHERMEETEIPTPPDAMPTAVDGHSTHRKVLSSDIGGLMQTRPCDVTGRMLFANSLGIPPYPTPTRLHLRLKTLRARWHSKPRVKGRRRSQQLLLSCIAMATAVSRHQVPKRLLGARPLANGAPQYLS